MKTNHEQLQLSQFDYELPEENIAQFPLEIRDTSKLLFYKIGRIGHRNFKELSSLLPVKSTLVFNETKVIPARIIFTKSSGARIEIFLLEPVLPAGGMEVCLAARTKVVWKAMVGNAKKWKEGQVLTGFSGNMKITAQWENREEQTVALQWENGMPFSEILEEMGKVPLPPYIKRSADQEDKSSYQTVYASRPGAVAAPTAGLHFTDAGLSQLKDDGHTLSQVTLHVGAGTFQPVMHEQIWEHPMHNEYFEVTANTLLMLRDAGDIIAVGTTSLRTLESLYWLAVLVEKTGNWYDRLAKEVAYTFQSEMTYADAMQLLLNYCKQHQLNSLSAFTGIMIVPGYNFKSAKGLITNFHMPKSTLIMLVNAFVGDNWRNIYADALAQNYRFLSYGDSSLLIRED